MSDFTYDSDDFSGIRTASTDLRNTQFSAFMGAIAAISTNLLWNAHQVGGTQPIWRRVNVRSLPTALVLGGLGYEYFKRRYSMISLWSRARYDEAAVTVNKKYTSIISKTLDYSNWSKKSIQQIIQINFYYLYFSYRRPHFFAHLSASNFQ